MIKKTECLWSLWTNMSTEGIIIVMWICWMSLNAVICCQIFPQPLVNNYDMFCHCWILVWYLWCICHNTKIVLRAMAYSATNFYGFKQKLLILLPPANRIFLNIQFLNLCNLPFVCYLKQKMPLFLKLCSLWILHYSHLFLKALSYVVEPARMRFQKHQYFQR